MPDGSFIAVVGEGEIRIITGQVTVTRREAHTPRRQLPAVHHPARSLPSSRRGVDQAESRTLRARFASVRSRHALR